MTRFGSFTAVLLLAAALLCSAPACRKKPPTLPELQPLTAGDEAGLVLFGTLRLGMRYLDRATRARYLREMTGQAEDPFLSGDPGREDPFLIFLLTVENTGSEPALISPSFASLMDEKGKFKIGPVDIHEMSALMASNPAFTPAVAQRFHQPTINVNPGSRHAKLLAFPAMERKAGMVDVLIPSVVAGTVSADAHFPFSVTWEPVPGF